MFIDNQMEISRRAFMRRTGQLAVAGAASSYALGLAGIGEAAAFNATGGYKALVCVFLYGGNDYGNTLIPYDSLNYGRYSAIRGGGSEDDDISIARESLASTVLNQPNDQVLTDDIRYALAPTMPRLKARFDQGVMAPLLNVGPLITPLTKAQFESANTVAYPRPPKLFSHNDQQSTWQSFQPEGSPTGWGGRMGDLGQSANTNAMFTAINATGNAVFLTGESAAPFQVGTKGAVTINGLENPRIFGSSAARDALETVLANTGGHVFERDYANMVARTVEYGGFVNDALDGANVTTSFGAGNRLASQLEVVARLISVRQNLGVDRQVFLVSMGGFDHHDGLIGSHEALLGELDFAMDAFYRATVELGVADRVTTFTASDFGRTLASNGDGTDHGWGGHHFIMGDAVNGGQFYGTAPHVSLETDDQVGRGRLLPSTSVDEYSSTLAMWLGVSPSELPSVAPNIGNFANPDLGFMQL